MGGQEWQSQYEQTGLLIREFKQYSEQFNEVTKKINDVLLIIQTSLKVQPAGLTNISSTLTLLQDNLSSEIQLIRQIHQYIDLQNTFLKRNLFPQQQLIDTMKIILENYNNQSIKFLQQLEYLLQKELLSNVELKQQNLNSLYKPLKDLLNEVIAFIRSIFNKMQQYDNTYEVIPKYKYLEVLKQLDDSKEQLQNKINTIIVQQETINHLQDLVNRNKIISNLPDEDKSILFNQKLEGLYKEINQKEEIFHRNIKDQAEQWKQIQDLDLQKWRKSNETLLKRLDLKQKSVVKIYQQNWELVQEIEQYMAEIDKLKKSHEEKTETIEQYKNEINKLKVEKYNLQNQLNEHISLSSKFEDQKETITKLKQKITQQSTTIADQSESIQQLKQKIQTQDEIILQKSTEIQTIRQNNQFIHEQEEYFILIQKIKKQSTTIADQSESIQQLKQQIQNQYEIIHKQEEYFISQIKTRDDSIIDLNIKVRQLELQLKNCKKCPYCNGIDQNYNEISQNNPLRFNKIPFESLGHQDSVTQAIISQDGTLIVSSSNDKTIKIWNAKSKQILQKIQLPERGQPIALSSNNQYLAYYCYQGQDSKIQLYDIKQNKHFRTLNISNPFYRIESIVFSLDSKYLLFGGEDKKIIIWGMVDMKQVHIFEIYHCIQMINISSDNKLISCLTTEGTIQIWDFQTKVKLIQENNAHEYGRSLCSSADSSIYVTSGSEGKVKIWKLNQLQDNKYSLTLTLQIKAGSSYVDTLLTMDNQYIISMCNNDGTIRIYERESGRLIQDLCSGGDLPLYQYQMIQILTSANFTDIIRVWTRE